MTKSTINRIKKIALAQIKITSDPPHGLAHIKAVVKNSLKIVKLLNLTDTEIDLNLLKAVCYLHDLTYVDHQPSLKVYILEGEIAQSKARKILESLKTIQSQDKKLILDTMLHHVHSYPFKNVNSQNSIYTKILQDADTIEFFNPKRVKLFQRQAKYNYIYKILQIIAPFFIKKGRKNIIKYLNFPQSQQLLNDY